MEEHWLWYLAGAFDTAGTISVKISKDDRLDLGYDFMPSLSFSRKESNDAIFGMLDEYCEDNQVHYRIEDHSDRGSIRLIIENPESVRRFLEPISEAFIQQREGAELMLNEILPGMEEDKHRTKEGFYELMEHVDKLRESNSLRRTPKYTQDYFMKEWKMR